MCTFHKKFKPIKGKQLDGIYFLRMVEDSWASFESSGHEIRLYSSESGTRAWFRATGRNIGFYPSIKAVENREINKTFVKMIFADLGYELRL